MKNWVAEGIASDVNDFNTYMIRYYYKYTRISTYSFKIKFMLAWTKASLPVQNQTDFLLVKLINIVRKIRTFDMSKQQGKIVLVLVFVDCT